MSGHESTYRLTGAPGLRFDRSSGRLRQLRARLSVVTGPQAGRQLIIESNVVIGTDDACGLTLEDRAVSRRHVEISIVEEGAQVVDLRSTNGTWVRGLKVGTVHVDPASSTQIRVGETELRLTLEEEDLGPTAERDSFGTLTTHAPAMRSFFGLLAKVAPTEATILLNGETGSGKDVVAHAIHEASRRRGRFIVFDCGAMPENLIESALFGHVRGAFSGATESRDGLAATAHHGTLFLDEIGELPLHLQSRLLRLLESHTTTPVGGSSAQPVDVRFLAATHRNLEAMVAAGQFRRDLFFRLSVIHLHVPALRERPEDLLPLARLFAGERGKDLELSAALTSEMMKYQWPGNIRELRNFVERALAGLPFQPEAPGSDAPARELAAQLPFKEAKEQLFDAFTRDYLLRLSASHNGNVTRMAEAAGLARAHLHRLLKQHCL